MSPLQSLYKLCSFFYINICCFAVLYGGANFAASHWNGWSPLQQCCATAQPVIRPPCPHRFWVSQFFCSCSYHLEFPSLGYAKQFYHILFSPPTQNLLLQNSFSASLVPIPPPAQRLRFGRSITDIVRFTNSFTLLYFTLLYFTSRPTRRQCPSLLTPSPAWAGRLTALYACVYVCMSAV